MVLHKYLDFNTIGCSPETDIKTPLLKTPPTELIDLKTLSWCLHRNISVSLEQKETPQATKENHKYQCHHKTFDPQFVLSQKYDIVAKIGHWWHKTCETNQPVFYLS